MKPVCLNRQAVLAQIANAATKYRRDLADICLLAVSKMQPAEKLADAYDCGQRDFGENYLQEALEKQSLLKDKNITWHFIGPIQSNKTRDIAEHFDWVHSVDREKIARRLNDQRPPTMAPLNILVQVNIDDEPSKSGVRPDELPALLAAIDAMPRLKLRGFMAIPAPSDDFDEQRRVFAQMRQLKDQYAGLDQLSMGMSGDLEAAIAEGATIVRIGTAIFGARK